MPDTHSSLPDLHRDLIKAAENKKLLPIVAAGVSMSVLDENNEPLFLSWKAVLQAVSAQLKKSDKSDQETADIIDGMLSAGDYQEAADYARQGLKGDSWSDFFEQHFNHDLTGLDLTLSERIWEISQSIITLNYDKVLEEACSPKPSVYDNRSTDEIRSFTQKNKKELWHLHGRVDNKNDIIFTSESYKNLYRVDEEFAGYYEAALQRLQSLSSSHHLLFIGCSMDDAELIETLAQQNKIFANNTGPHFVMVRENNQSFLKAKLKKCGVNFVFIPYTDFGQPLLDKVNQIVDACQPIATPTPVIPAPSTSESVITAAPTLSQNEQCKANGRSSA